MNNRLMQHGNMQQENNNDKRGIMKKNMSKLAIMMIMLGMSSGVHADNSLFSDLADDIISLETGLKQTNLLNAVIGSSRSCKIIAGVASIILFRSLPWDSVRPKSRK